MTGSDIAALVQFSVIGVFGLAALYYVALDMWSKVQPIIYSNSEVEE